MAPLLTQVQNLAIILGSSPRGPQIHLSKTSYIKKTRMFKGHATALLPSMLAITDLILAAIIGPGHDNHVLITLQVCAVPQLPAIHTEARPGF